ncbi:2-hydroxymuconic semialdehyde dehydrogenase [Pukyongiella litopenaei]|uniref:2-hydroxymuconic semialdehyde dehydrogenase n=1 Tax=Pukyongiella litopenaei TaxID=2605946 RepID=A0A2S0MQZ1_9RHOB|nr:2-hydroxymuconic semialdehyde dehydrogenase [Pukyongiella litopenaei]AVO38171.1 2-hydroxymuconic semialdehyde dehydrogenase [Pukyongiella litopenaei]
MTEFNNFIDGRFVAGRGDAFANHFPTTGEVIGQIRAADRDQVDAAVGAARAALKGPWGKMSTPDRMGLLRKLADAITARFDDFLAAEIRDTGKPRSIASHIDIPRGAANFGVFADQVAVLGTECFDQPTPDGAGALNYAIRTPRGVIAVICPWNLPLLLMTWKVAPALACGNTVVVKPSEETPATATLLGEVMNDVGIPPGVYNVIHGRGPGCAGEFLTSHPDVDGITFTGETRTGEAIMRAAASGVRPVSLELGGKNPGIIFDDADFDATMEGIGRACFANTGQVCLGTERIYVQRGIFDRVAEGLAQQARGYRLGDPFDDATTMGPVISAGHREKVLSYYDKARAAGADILAGGGTPEMQGYEGGYWVQPTVWTGLAEDAAVVTDEIFGPCTHLQPFDSEDEAVALANNSPYGLATSIWTTNLARAHRVAAQVEVGISWVNCWFLRDLRTAFGGAKSSGIGREGGIHSMEFYSELRNVCVKL